jgi:hypothetical protein
MMAMLALLLQTQGSHIISLKQAQDNSFAIDELNKQAMQTLIQWGDDLSHTAGTVTGYCTSALNSKSIRISNFY